MSAVADTPAKYAENDRLARRNALVLAVALALAGGNNTVLIATGSLVGAMLAPDRGLATVPISVYVLGMWLGTLPVGALAQRFGRRTTFQIGTVFGVLTGLIACLAVLGGSFALFNLGALCSGFYAAAHQAYRFAAADTASEAFKPKAISWVMIGGVAAAIVGPQLVITTKDLWLPYMFAATFLAQALLAAVSAGVLMLVNIPNPPARVAGEEGHPLGAIARQPRFIAAVVCGVASYAMMNLVMTSAPLAMIDCAHSVTDATLGLQWHVLGMFVPSFFTGSLIVRFGVERIVATGFGLLLVSSVVSIAGITLWHFWIGLALLGVGWNLSFVGATTMVTQCHRPYERNRVQAFNDFLVFGSMAIASFSSGQVLAHFGWVAVNEIVFPVVLAAGALLAWSVIQARRSAGAV
jgi:predicted MFS family arabinose efflux permease